MTLEPDNTKLTEAYINKIQGKAQIINKTLSILLEINAGTGQSTLPK